MMPPPAPGTASLWRQGDFRKLWAAETISVFGSQFTLLAIPLIAALTLQASPVEMGILAAVDTAPFLLIGLFAGVWVDRLRRRPVLIAADLGRALLLATIPLAAFAGEIASLVGSLGAALGLGALAPLASGSLLGLPQLYVVGFLVGVLTVFFDVAYQAYLPALVERSQLVEGNSKLEVSRSAAQLAGPGLAGLVVQYLSAPVAIALDALSFALSAAFLGLIGKPEATPDRAGRASLLVEAREGLAVVFGNRLLWSIAGCTGTWNFFGSLAYALYVLFAARELQMAPAALGLAFGAGNVGALVGAVAAARLATRFGVGPTIVGSALLGGLALLPVPFATPELALPLLLGSGLLGSFTSVTYNVNQVSLRQAITPHRLQGRMNATMRFVVWGTMPLGGLAGGALGQELGLRPALLIGVLGSLVAFLWVFLSPVRRLERIPATPPEA
jgi:MFS family permease